MKHPHITWPHSVARHPHYMKALADFDRVWAISRASREELLGYWSWLGMESPPRVEVLTLGADFDGSPRMTSAEAAPGTGTGGLLCVGILEPRKNQMFLLDVCSDLWEAGLRFTLHVVGRINPHFGKPIAARLRAMVKRYPGLRYHEAASDETLAGLYATARATVFPTITEGCGLPLLESLWRGVPCVCSDLPVLRENADEGGCVPVAVNDRAAWAAALQRVLSDDAAYRKLCDEARTRDLPTWRQAGAILRAGLSD
jgi:glycosyltransferase involved in cell wall biosynthesis